MKTEFLKTNEAVANYSGTMEARDHLKNGTKPKSHTSKRNFIIYSMLLLAFFAFANKTLAWQGSGTEADPWLIGDGATNTSAAVKAKLEDGTLTIFGAGNMADFLFSIEGQTPWRQAGKCSDIQTVVIESGVTNIGDVAFQDCSNMKVITIPEGIRIIGTRSFENCTLLSAVAIPSSVAEIEEQAFLNCTGLLSIANMAVEPQSINSNVFQGVTVTEIYLAVPYDAIETYKSTNVWNNFKVAAPYVLFKENLDNTIDEVILGLDGSAYFYEYQKNNPNLPKRLTIYDSVEDEVKMIIDYNNDGLPSKIVSVPDNMTVFFDRYEGNKCIATVLSQNGVSQNFDINADISSLGIFDPLTKASIGVGIVGCGLSFYTGSMNLLSYAGCLGTLNNITNALGIGAIVPDYVAYALLPSLKVASLLLSCSTAVAIPNPLSVTKCVVSVAGMVITIAKIFSGDNEKCPTNSWNITNDGTLYIHSNDAFSCSPYPWAYRKDEITKLVIGGGVTTIPVGAFQGCTNLQSVKIEYGSEPLTFENSGNWYTEAFLGSSIGTLNLSRNIEYGFNVPFAGNTLLTSLEIGNNVTSIGANCFDGCIGLTKVTFGSGLNSIGDNAFRGCTNIASALNIPAGVKTIGNAAFRGCEQVPSLVIPGSVVSIGTNAFTTCSNLANITIEYGSEPLTFENSGNWYTEAFLGSSIGTLNLSRNIEYGNVPFAGNTLLTSLEIGNNVTSIGANCFDGCIGLTKVTFGSGLNSIGDNAFRGCSNIASALNIPAGVKTIGNGAFRGCEQVPSLVIPGSVVSIGTNAFTTCSNLTNITIEHGSEPLIFENSGNWYTEAFLGSSIGTLHLGRNIKYGFNIPFAGNTLLTSLEIGNNVTFIDANCFNGCTGLTQITSNPTTPPTIYINTFYGVDKGIPVYINCDYLTAYQREWSSAAFTNYVCETTPTSNDATLKSLTVSEGTLTPAFDANTTNYTVDVANSVTNITLTAAKNHNGANVSGDGTKTSLIVGDNTFYIVVTAEDGTTRKTYTVVVNRAKTEYTKSNDATLKDLTVSNGSLTPEFDANTFYYTVHVANSVTNITLTATKNHSGATVSGDGTKTSLIVGDNTYEIIVAAEDGTTKKTYTVVVNRAEALVNAQTPTISSLQQTATYTQDATPSALTVTANVTDGGTLSYQWYSNTTNNTTEGKVISGATGASYTPSTATVGTMYYYVIVTNTNVNVTGTKTATATSNTTIVTVTKQSVTGIETHDTPIARVYPNPTDDAITLEFEEAGEYVFTISDMTGKILLLQTINDCTARLVMSHFPSGVYLLTIDDGKRQSTTRVIKN